MTPKTFPAKAAFVIANPKSKLLDQMSEVLRIKHYSLRTEEAYVQWGRRYLIFCRDHPHLTPAMEPNAAPHPAPLPSGNPHPAFGHPLHSRETPHPACGHLLPIGCGEGKSDGRGAGAERVKRWRHPRDFGATEVVAFLNHLASSEHVAAATQNQALNAISFLYTQVLGLELGDLGEFLAASKPRRVPVVLSKEETQRLLAALEGTWRLMAQMLYGTGLRLMELLRLRVHPVR